LEIQLTGQETQPNQEPGEPLMRMRGRWRGGGLGDAIVTLCHLEPHIWPTQTLRLPLRGGGKPKQEIVNGGSIIRR
jgi:hypothetical protein